MPFANCKPYMKEEGRITKPVTLADVRVEWEYAGEAPTALVYLFGELLAIIRVGDKPGCSRFALANGPLARVLVPGNSG